MDETRRDWTSLPAEILNEIFLVWNDLYTIKPSRNFALVCKSWLIPATSILYSHVIISRVSQLERFNRTVKETPHIGEKVKIFKLYTPVRRLNKGVKEHIFDLAENLLSYLPNLEEIGGDGFYSYLPILNALQDSQLKYLKRLSVPFALLEKSEVSNYATCVLFLKDIIEKVEIAEDLEFIDGTTNEQIQSRRLYKRLHQFKKIEELRLTQKTLEEIQVLEHVIETCKSLKCLHFQFYGLDNEDSPISSNNNTSVDAISNFTPAKNINTLLAQLTVTRDYKTLLYLMKKFPQLDTFTFIMDGNSSAPLNHHILTKLLNYSHKIKTFSASQIFVDEDTVAETFRDYWISSSKPGSKCVEFIYKLFDSATYSLDILQDPKKTITSFTFSLSIMDARYVGFIEKNGKFINELRIKCSASGQFNPHKPPKKFIANVLTHCSNLRKLEVSVWILERFFYVGKKYSLDELFINRCHLCDGALEGLSSLLSKVKVLRFHGSLSSDNESSTLAPRIGYPKVEIIMPDTEIDCISFKEPFFEKPVHLMVLTEDPKQCTYHRFQKIVEVSNEEVYFRSTNDLHVYVRCKSTPKFEFLTYWNI